MEEILGVNGGDSRCELKRFRRCSGSARMSNEFVRNPIRGCGCLAIDLGREIFRYFPVTYTHERLVLPHLLSPCFTLWLVGSSDVFDSSVPASSPAKGSGSNKGKSLAHVSSPVRAGGKKEDGWKEVIRK